MSDLDRQERDLRAGRALRMLVWALIAAAVVVFALSNTQQVSVDWVFGEAETALWIVIGACAGVGFLAGLAVTSRRR